MSRVAALLVAASLCTSAASAQTAPDATVVDGEVHHVGLENEHVRVLQVLAEAGTRSPMHSHPPLVLVSMATGRVRITLPDGKKQILNLQPGTVLWVNGAEHSWELLSGQINVVAVEVKAAKATKAR